MLQEVTIQGSSITTSIQSYTEKRMKQLFTEQKKIESKSNSTKEEKVNSRIQSFFLYRISFKLVKKPSKNFQLSFSRNHR